MARVSTPLAEAEPAWEIARLFPSQGKWSVDDYLDLSTESRQLVEYSRGFIEVLEMPTQVHQFILQAVFGQLSAFAARTRACTVITAPFRVRLGEDEFREPDVAVMLAEHGERRTNQFWVGADLVVEIVSEGKRARDRDTLVKRADYAAAGVPEYWIVSPKDRTVVVLTLDVGAGAYVEHGVYRPGETGSGPLLPGMGLDVAAVFAAAEA